MGSDRGQDFMTHAQQPRLSLAREMWDFLATNKKWWLLPILIVLLLLGLLATAGGTGLAPFIYTLF